VASARVASFATPRPGTPPPHRFLFHARAAGSGAHVLVQLTVDRSAGSARVAARSDDSAAAAHVVELLQLLLLSL
jgi:hypothetical protein